MSARALTLRSNHFYLATLSSPPSSFILLFCLVSYSYRWLVHNFIHIRNECVNQHLYESIIRNMNGRLRCWCRFTSTSTWPKRNILRRRRAPRVRMAKWNAHNSITQYGFLINYRTRSFIARNMENRILLWSHHAQSSGNTIYIER